MTFRHVRHSAGFLASTEFPGDYSAGATPLPIPNREVKPRSADGTGLWPVE